MKIVQLNATYKVGSTGKIMSDLNDVICGSDNNGFMVSGYYHECDNANLYCTSRTNPFWEIRKNILISRLTGTMGYRYLDRTKATIHWIDEINPDIIHLHNIHGDWIHLETLFDYIKTKRIPVVWTLHDCWAFTGRCSYFEGCGCDKWKSKCQNCVDKTIYPTSYFFDKSCKMFMDKKTWFSGIDNMTIVTPSKWLANYVKQSFLREYPIKVINNGIDTNVFSPQKNRSKYYKDIEGKKIIIGVAGSWSERKGFGDILQLDKLLDHDKYQIVMVGLNSKQMKQIPQTIVGISRTNNQQELAELYSGADVFINPTYQDNFPTTNLEALACGIPVITYPTGGSPEAITEKTGCVLDNCDVKLLLEAVANLVEKGRFSITDCRERGLEFDKKIKFQQYLDLYNSLKRN